MSVHEYARRGRMFGTLTPRTDRPGYRSFRVMDRDGRVAARLITDSRGQERWSVVYAHVVGRHATLDTVWEQVQNGDLGLVEFDTA